jgi:hypothetical protein
MGVCLCLDLVQTKDVEKFEAALKRVEGLVRRNPLELKEVSRCPRCGWLGVSGCVAGGVWLVECVTGGVWLVVCVVGGVCCLWGVAGEVYMVGCVAGGVCCLWGVAGEVYMVGCVAGRVCDWWGCGWWGVAGEVCDWWDVLLVRCVTSGVCLVGCILWVYLVGVSGGVWLPILHRLPVVWHAKPYLLTRPLVC